MNRCQKLNIAHVWKEIIPRIYPTNPRQYPPRSERCLYCGLIRILREAHDFWIEYDRTEEKEG